ncbi:hypothetical protein AGMMS49525_02550 [Bacteroidia bacterium]|nr:hypothetical protein AGMMS49525_02550 [Bacteroidia bacterium]
MFAQLGNHIFQGLKSPDSWSESYAKRYAKIPLINGKDVIQATGEELAEISLSIHYSDDFADPATEIEALKQSMSSAEILPFMTGEGDVVGVFVITDLEVSNESFSETGQLTAATVSLSLLEYAQAEKPKKKGSALLSSKPKPQAPKIPGLSAAKSICKELSKAKGAVNQMKSTMKSVKKGLKTTKRAVKEIRRTANAAKQAYSTAKTKLEVTKKIIKRAGKLPTSLDGAIRYAENLTKLDTVLDTTVLEMNIKEMSTRADRVTTDAAPVSSFAASKEGGN